MDVYHPALSSLRILGIAGGKRVGKDAAARYLHVRGFTPIALADAVKWIVGPGSREEILKCNKPPRQLWQLVGTEIGRQIDNDVWLKNALIRIVSMHEFCGESQFVITDLRFKNEVQTIRNWGGRVILLTRKDAPSDDGHISETEARELGGDAEIVNDGSLVDLYARLKEALEEFGWL